MEHGAQDMSLFFAWMGGSARLLHGHRAVRCQMHPACKWEPVVPHQRLHGAWICLQPSPSESQLVPFWLRPMAPLAFVQHLALDGNYPEPGMGHGWPNGIDSLTSLTHLSLVDSYGAGSESGAGWDLSPLEHLQHLHLASRGGSAPWPLPVLTGRLLSRVNAAAPHRPFAQLHAAVRSRISQQDPACTGVRPFPATAASGSAAPARLCSLRRAYHAHEPGAGGVRPGGGAGGTGPRRLPAPHRLPGRPQPGRPVQPAVHGAGRCSAGRGGRWRRDMRAGLPAVAHAEALLPVLGGAGEPVQGRD